MWPLSSRRSRTFSTSKLGYLASRAPSAMFSRSRKTAMVASDVLAVIQWYSSWLPEFTPFHAARLRRLEPIVVEADADAFRIDAVGHHFMPQPTFEKNQFSRSGGKGAPRTGLALCGGFARRRGHETIQARILEFDSGGSGGDVYVVGAAQGRQRMQMQAMHHLPRHDVDPAIGHLQFAPVKIPLDGFGEGSDMPRKSAFQGLEGGGNTLQPVHRSIRGIAARIVFGGPPPAGRIVVAKLPALLQKLAVEFLRSAFLQGVRVHERRK